MARDIVLHMGFLNTPYTKPNMAAPMAAVKAYKAKVRRGFTKTMTAEDVGNILESNYGILDVFKEVYNEEITNIVSETFENFIVETLTEVRKPTSARMVKYMAPKTREIEKMFRGFLDKEEMNGMAEGVPTKAALTGGSRRRKRSGPSFIDTGIYRASFRAWADIK
jgi:hypothetical protein